jgi:ankyrin repeat protein
MAFLEESDIMKAVNDGDLDRCKELIAAGVDVKAQGGGRDPLSAACQRRRIDLCRVLIEAGADVNDSAGAPLLTAATQGDVEICLYLVSVGADVNLRSPLMGAAGFGFVEVCRALIDMGADVGDVGSDGRTALTMAIRYGRVEVVRLLVEAGVPLANAMEDSRFGALTAFQLAVRYGKEDMAAYLLEVCGEDPAQRSAGGHTMMHLAGKNAVIKQMLRSAKAASKVVQAFAPELCDDCKPGIVTQSLCAEVNEVDARHARGPGPL